MISFRLISLLSQQLKHTISFLIDSYLSLLGLVGFLDGCLVVGLCSASSMSLLGNVLISAIASYVFVGIDEVGMEVENCFSLLPLQQLACAAHFGVRDQLASFNDAPPMA
jgi:hypothetical protein